MSNETYTYVNLRLRALELAIEAFEDYDDGMIVGVAEKFLAFLEASPKVAEVDVVRVFDELVPVPRKFYSNVTIPDDVEKVVTVDGWVAQRAEEKGWSFVRRPDGRELDPDAFGWSYFDMDEFPVTEVL